MNTDQIKQAYNDLIRARGYLNLHRKLHCDGLTQGDRPCYEFRRLSEIEKACSTEYREVVKEWLG